MNSPADSHAAATAAEPQSQLIAVEDCEAAVEAVEQEAQAMRDVSERLLNLNQIGLALSSERDIEALLWLILTKARELTDADAGSLYILEDPEEHEVHAHQHALAQAHAEGAASSTCSPASGVAGAAGEKVLYFRLSQNDSVALPSEMQRFPVGGSTLAGYVAATGRALLCEDAYCIAADAPYKFTPRWDTDNGYRTRSVLVVPMKNRDGAAIGVLQLINRKRRPLPLSSPEAFERLVVPFDEELAHLAEVVASHAAVAIESNRLLSQVTRLLAGIETAFDSFVRAAAQLIDDRDPPTAGHSQRVTKMTLALAEAAAAETSGPFAAVRYSPREIQELRYAALLHDVGKIGVSESIFSKSHKIEPAFFHGVLHRVARYQDELERQAQAAILNAWKTLSREQATREEERLLQVLDAETKQLHDDRAALVQANEPSAGWLSDDEFALQQAAIARLSGLAIEEDGRRQVLVEEEEARALGVRRGSLSQGERKQMEAHAQMSFEFLEQIAWPPHLARIPALAHCHHEKLDGSGYPLGIRAPDIPLLGRMMTVSDIFDALVAADRPYKRAMPLERALEILRDEARRGMLDSDVVDLFLRHRAWEAA